VATSYSAYTATKWLDALFNNTSFAVTTVSIQLHTGDPGAAGTSNVATESARKTVSMAAASAGAISSDADITWTSVSATETFTHFTLWDASTSGNFLGSGTVTNGAVTSGTDFTLGSADLDITMSAAS